MPTKKQRLPYQWIIIYMIDGRFEGLVKMYKTLKNAEKQKAEWEDCNGRSPLGMKFKAIIISADDLMDWERRGIGELERMLRL